MSAASEREGRGRADPTEAPELFERLPDPKARDELVRIFLPLAEHLARRFTGRGEPIDDLVQVANLGLLHAVDRFDPSREVRFSTFAAVTIVGELKRHFRDKAWSVRVPRSLQEAALVANRATAALWQELGRSPSAAEVAERAHLSQEQVLEAMEARQAYAAASLDAPMGEDDNTSSDVLGDPDDGFAITEGWASIEPALLQLPTRERTIIYLRFFRGLTQAEIAKEIGISQMHVSRLLSRALERVREASQEMDRSIEAPPREPGSPS
jgi:RNA polymerase sigma-B factor